MEEFLKVLSQMDINRGIAILAVLGFGVFAIVKIFSHMKKGFGTFNMRVTGIVIVATFASILAVLSPSSESAAIGILGAIAGYLFGFGTEKVTAEDTPPESPTAPSNK